MFKQWIKCEELADFVNILHPLSRINGSRASVEIHEGFNDSPNNHVWLTEIFVSTLKAA